jgi:signal transduction histidine kinase
MGKFATSPFNALLQDAALAHTDISPRQVTGASPVLSNDIVHELRQPLGVIDSLAYYLELIATDDKSSGHLQRIRAMVAKTNSILERAVEHEDRSFEPELVGS